jgi:hypothetical protein
MSAMKSFFNDLHIEVRGIIVSPAGIIYLVIQGLLTGYNFYSAIGSYSCFSVPPDGGIMPVPFLEPSADLFSPVFHASYLCFSLFLPIVYSGIIAGHSGKGRFNFISQFFGIGRTLYIKIMAGLIFYAVILVLSLPAVFYWLMLGGSVYADELVLLYGGYLLLGLFILALTLCISSLLKNRLMASAAVMLLIASSFWIIGICFVRCSLDIFDSA